MRHVRDPITGRNPNGEPNHSSWDTARKKIIYVNAFNQPPPPAHRSPSPSRRSYRDYDNDSGITNGSHGSPRGSVLSTSRVGLVHAGSPGYHGSRAPSPPSRYRERSPSPKRRSRTPPGRGRSPGRDTYNRDDGRKSYYRDDPEYGRGGRYGKKGGYHHGGGGQGGYGTGARGAPPSACSRRGCCVALLGILGLLLLAGLIAGLYFGIKALIDYRTYNEPTNLYPGGYYQNGIYMYPVTQEPAATYFIYGTDTPCNPFNNNTAGSNNFTNPNCDGLTTSIIKQNLTTTTPLLVMTTAGANDLSLSFSMLSLFFSSFLALSATFVH